MQIILIHGFYGLPLDWQEVQKHLTKKGETLNLWRDVNPQGFSNLSSAGEEVSRRGSGSVVVVGYSLGGRLLLHWPESDWGRIQKMILISVHGGLESEAEKKVRRQMDQNWAQRFLQEPWEDLQESWRAQAVFSGDQKVPRREEKDFSRPTLAAALTAWSLGLQEERFSLLQRAPFPIHYVSGEKDEKFSQYAEQLQKKYSNWRYHSLSGGHNLLWSHGRELAKIIGSDD